MNIFEARQKEFTSPMQCFMVRLRIASKSLVDPLTFKTDCRWPSSPCIHLNQLLRSELALHLKAVVVKHFQLQSCLAKLFPQTIAKIMVKPRHHCCSLPPVDLRRKSTGGVLSVTVVSASNLGRNSMKSSNSETRQSTIVSSHLSGNLEKKALKTFVEVEVGDITKRASASEDGTVEAEGSTFLKTKLEKKRNDDETEEWWVQCDKFGNIKHNSLALIVVLRRYKEDDCLDCLDSLSKRGKRDPGISGKILMSGFKRQNVKKMVLEPRYMNSAKDVNGQCLALKQSSGSQD
ncbi:hypothetical protein OPV22_024047 [Ensete ventricosum]|uniref:BRX domain-containing protein n=1 Tax=Ensete ventricosum TaxID=4639 RepID=A0AAV8PDJ8_ENSVE|nr:hypothetical protein OPV22_024047 [Ensete ventricosum]